MDDTHQERLREGFSPEKKAERVEKPKETKDVKERAQQVIGTQEGLQVEGADIGAEAPSEFAGDSAGEQGGQSGGGTATAPVTDQAAMDEIRAKLLKALPPQKEMVRQIKNSLIRQEKELTVRMKKLQGRSHTSAFELTIVVAKLRKVREFFALLAHATYDVVKNLWLKIVHGV